MLWPEVLSLKCNLPVLQGVFIKFMRTIEATLHCLAQGETVMEQ
jgi:hypothetical protein